jgi:two-component SAPR family response regulator
MEITKESIIDNILYNTKNSNYKALVDVEINKVRITFQSFLSELFQEKIEKEVLIYKDKKYFLVSKNMELDIKIDVDEFKKLCSSKNINDLKKAFEMYKTDFAKDLYNNWAEDIRENLRFMYTDLIYKLITHFEREKDNNSLIN